MDDFAASRSLEFLHVSAKTGEKRWFPYWTHTRDLDYDLWPNVYEDRNGKESTRPRHKDSKEEHRLHLEYVKTHTIVSRRLQESE